MKRETYYQPNTTRSKTSLKLRYTNPYGVSALRKRYPYYVRSW